MAGTALIFGAGKTGRGFAAHLALLGGYDIILIDGDRRLIDGLRTAGHYDIRLLDGLGTTCTIKPAGVFHIDDPRLDGLFYIYPAGLYGRIRQ